jgi:hypothetical protein
MHHHLFADELPAPDGNFYPRHSKLWPAGAADDFLVKTRDGPPISPAYLGMLHLEAPKARIYELEKERVGRGTLTAAEEEELQELRRRHPRIAEVVSWMNLLYDFWFEQELKIATKAGLGIVDAIRQAKDVCLRFEKFGCVSKWDLQQLRDDGSRSYDPPVTPPADTATQSFNEPKPTQ